MSLANLLTEAGSPPNDVSATSTVHLSETEAGFSVTLIELDVVGDVPDLDEPDFVRLAEQSKATCPISRALAGTEIQLNAHLVAPALGGGIAWPRRCSLRTLSSPPPFTPRDVLDNPDGRRTHAVRLRDMRYPPVRGRWHGTRRDR